MVNVNGRKRQAKGTPIGGQFAQEARTEPTVSLTKPVNVTQLGAQVEELLVAEHQSGYLTAEQLAFKREDFEAYRDTRDADLYERELQHYLETQPRLFHPNPTWLPASGVPAGPGQYSRAYGGRAMWKPDYKSKKSVNAQIAQKIRDDIKDAIAGNYLPADLTYKVTSNQNAVELEVTGISVEDYYDKRDMDWRNYAGDEGWRLKGSVFVNELYDRVSAIHQQFNWNGSDSQTDYFDVRYYGVANVLRPEAAASSACFNAEEKLRLATRRGEPETKLVALKQKLGETQNQKTVIDTQVAALKERLSTQFSPIN